jgi:aspartate-semialdehyde dehydrogenase
MKIAIVGATGLVGQKMLQVLKERKFDKYELIPAASAKSAGTTISFSGKDLIVVTVENALAQKPDIAIFSAGGQVSKHWAEKFATAGTFVIDNSSAWRLHENVPLVVPEINAAEITPKTKIIANPNCSTIQMVVALAPLHREYGIRRLVISTYQSVTGTGMKGVEQLANERKGINSVMVYPYPIDLNVLPHGGDFNPDGYTAEEQKLVDETRKILSDQNIQITATVVRVPVFGGHSESVNVETKKSFRMEDIFNLMKKSPGVFLLDEPENNIYPTPLAVQNRDEVFVGRLRRDHSLPNALNMWIVSDNLRKGAATNAVQIAEYLCRHQLV